VVKCVNRAGIEVRDIVLEPLASSLAVLTNDEKELGCALLDIGGGTTDLAVFHDEAIRYTSVIGLGGKNVTSDIAIGLRTPIEDAETIKVNHGCTLKSMIDKKQTIQVPSPGDREPRNMSLEILGTIIMPRTEELFNLAKHEIEKNDYAGLIGAGVVLTGGASLLKGSVELAEQIFDMPAKVGYPRGFSGITDIIGNPSYATVLGLILYEDQSLSCTSRFTGGKKSGIINGIVDSLKKWFKDFV